MDMKGGIVRTCVENVSAKIKPVGVMLINLIFTLKGWRGNIKTRGVLFFSLVWLQNVLIGMCGGGGLCPH